MFRAAIITLIILTSVQVSAAAASKELMYVQGRFLGIHPTGMHLPTSVFVFRTQYRLHGLWQVPAPAGEEPEPMDELFRFALPLAYGGHRLIAQIMGTSDFKSYEDVDKALPDSPVFRLVLWRLSSEHLVGVEMINAELVSSPAAIPK